MKMQIHEDAAPKSWERFLTRSLIALLFAGLVGCGSGVVGIVALSSGSSSSGSLFPIFTVIARVSQSLNVGSFELKTESLPPVSGDPDRILATELALSVPDELIEGGSFVVEISTTNGELFDQVFFGVQGASGHFVVTLASPASAARIVITLATEIPDSITNLVWVFGVRDLAGRVSDFVSANPTPDGIPIIELDSGPVAEVGEIQVVLTWDSATEVDETVPANLNLVLEVPDGGGTTLVQDGMGALGAEFQITSDCDDGGGIESIAWPEGTTPPTGTYRIFIFNENNFCVLSPSVDVRTDYALTINVEGVDPFVIEGTFLDSSSVPPGRLVTNFEFTRPPDASGEEVPSAMVTPPEGDSAGVSFLLPTSLIGPDSAVVVASGSSGVANIRVGSSIESVPYSSSSPQIAIGGFAGTSAQTLNLTVDAASALTLSPLGTAEGSFLLLPESVLGTRYRTINRFQTDGDPSQIIVVAGEDNTSITFISQALSQLVGPDGIPVNVGTGATVTPLPLDRGESLVITSSSDLSGSLITASDPVGVFSGTEEQLLQIPPTTSWGSQAIVAPFVEDPTDPSELYELRILTDSGTDLVTISRTVFGAGGKGDPDSLQADSICDFVDLDPGSLLDFNSNSSCLDGSLTGFPVLLVESDEPILVFQLPTGSSSAVNLVPTTNQYRFEQRLPSLASRTVHVIAPSENLGEGNTPVGILLDGVQISEADIVPNLAPVIPSPLNPNGQQFVVFALAPGNTAQAISSAVPIAVVVFDAVAKTFALPAGLTISSDGQGVSPDGDPGVGGVEPFTYSLQEGVEVDVSLGQATTFQTSVFLGGSGADTFGFSVALDFPPEILSVVDVALVGSPAQIPDVLFDLSVDSQAGGLTAFVDYEFNESIFDDPVTLNFETPEPVLEITWLIDADGLANLPESGIVPITFPNLASRNVTVTGETVPAQAVPGSVTFTTDIVEGFSILAPQGTLESDTGTFVAPFSIRDTLGRSISSFSFAVTYTDGTEVLGLSLDPALDSENAEFVVNTGFENGFIVAAVIDITGLSPLALTLVPTPVVELELIPPQDDEILSPVLFEFTDDLLEGLPIDTNVVVTNGLPFSSTNPDQPLNLVSGQVDFVDTGAGSQ